MKNIEIAITLDTVERERESYSLLKIKKKIE